MACILKAFDRGIAMDKKRLNQILTVLLAPYCEKEFSKEGNDIIEDIRYKFSCLRERSNRMLDYEREECKKAFEKSEQKRDFFFRSHPKYCLNSLYDGILLLNLFFSESEIADLYQKTPNDIHVIENYYLNNLFKIAESLLTFRDGRMSIRTWMNPRRQEDIRYYEEDLFAHMHAFDKVEIWNLLNRKMMPDVLIAAFLVKAKLSEVRYLSGQGWGICLADTTLEPILARGVGETHFHMNAGAANMYYWEYATDYRNWERAVSNPDSYRTYRENTGMIDWTLVLLRLIVADYLENAKTGGALWLFIEQRWNQEALIIRYMLMAWYKGVDMPYNSSFRELYGVILQYYEEKRIASRNCEGEDYLAQTVYKRYQRYHVNSEMIFLLRYIEYLYNYRGDHLMRHLFFQYLRKKNDFYHMSVHSSQVEGVKNFRIFSDAVKKKNRFLTDENGTLEAARQMEIVFQSVSVNRHLKKLEFRTQPPVHKDFQLYERIRKTEIGKRELKREILKRLAYILEGMKRYAVKITGSKNRNKIKETLDRGVDNGDLVFPSIGVIFHFLKRDYVDNKIADSCWLLEKGELPEYSMHVLQWREQMIDSAKAIEELRSEVPGLADYIVGIDAASEENQTEPWVFAPVYAEIRNRYITKPVIEKENKVTRIHNLGFTYHVGEEFRHALSGFRHVDEVLRFFHYKAGDRIGHAIVLGIDLKRWAREHETVVVPIGEYLDDLLWLWGSSVQGEMDLGISIGILEGKILELAKQIYGEIVGMTPNMLYDAYCAKFKRDNSASFTKMRRFIKKEQIDGSDHFCKRHLHNNIVNNVWTIDKILCTFFCPIYYQRFQKPILVYIDALFIKIMEVVQRHLIEKIEQIGVYIEVNPTSNLAIGVASCIDDSHIFHLNSVDDPLIKEKKENDKHRALLTINSDDLAIFNSSCENELAYMYHSMTHQGYGKENTLQWIDKIRQYGIDSSFVKHVRKPSQQYEEIEELLERIKEY